MRAEPKLICRNWNILYPKTFEAQDTLPYVAQRSMNQMFGTIISQTRFCRRDKFMYEMVNTERLHLGTAK